MKFKEAKKLFRKNEKTYGLCLWEKEFDNFKLECWNMVNPTKSTVPDSIVIEPTIVQLWTGKNGYSIYRHSNK